LDGLSLKFMQFEAKKTDPK